MVSMLKDHDHSAARQPFSDEQFAELKALLAPIAELSGIMLADYRRHMAPDEIEKPKQEPMRVVQPEDNGAPPETPAKAAPIKPKAKAPPPVEDADEEEQD